MSVYKRGGHWQFSKTINGVRHRGALLTARSKAQAEQAEAKIILEIHQGEYGGRRFSPTLKDFVERVFVPWAKANRRSWKGDEGRLKSIERFFGAKRLSEISPFLIERFKVERRNTKIERPGSKSPAKPRLIYVNSIGDFDTHQGEAQRHPALMEQLDAGIDSFFTSLGKAADDVVLMTVSEFGRRPAENGSGTDHGTANVHFVVGPGVKGGRYGEQPSLANLDKNGNLVHTEDFRRLYATGLKWLRVDDTSPVLGDQFKSFSLFK